MNILDIIFGFLCFLVLQSLAINGLRRTFMSGMIFEGFAKWVRNNIHPFFHKPLVDCVECMSSVYGSVLYWSFVLPVFGFSFFEIWVWFWDIIILVFLNQFFYKKC